MIQFCCTFSLLLSGMICTSESAKEAILQKVMALPSELNECSGMASLEDDLYVGQNDSGNDPELIMFRLDGDDIHSVKIEKADNKDWEELAEDETYIYIGDFGNNSGNRKNLVIYKVKKDDILKSDEGLAEKIEFSYPEQASFHKTENTNFDCEAMISVGDSLYLFTKNHGNLKTNLYSLPKSPGTYAAQLKGGFDAQGLITGADYRVNGKFGELVLVGYTNRMHGHQPFIYYFSKVDGLDFLASPSKRFQLDGQLQIESILFENGKSVLVSSEGKKKKYRNVYRVKL